MSIAIELIDQLENLAATNGIARIESVTMAAGVNRGVVPEAMEMAFAEASRSTVAEGARLELLIVPALVRCRACGKEFKPLPDSYLCGRCGRADVDWLAGDDIVLQSVTCIEEED